MNHKTKTILTIIGAALAGAIIALSLLKTGYAQSDKTNFKYPLEAKLQRFEVVEGKEEKFKEWMDFLRRERQTVTATLEGERMYFEAVFSEKTDDGRTYAYWLTFKGEGGKTVENSISEVDKKHLEYWKECVKKGSRVSFGDELYLTPEFLDRAIAEYQKTEKD